MESTELYYRLYRIYELLENKQYSEAMFEMELLIEMIKP